MVIPLKASIELTYSTKCGTIKASKSGEVIDEVPKIEKIIEKMKNQPNGIKPEEVEKVLKSYGYENVRQKGSHRQYLNKATGDLVTVKQENPLKKV